MLGSDASAAARDPIGFLRSVSPEAASSAPTIRNVGKALVSVTSLQGIPPPNTQVEQGAAYTWCGLTYGPAPFWLAVYGFVFTPVKPPFDLTLKAVGPLGLPAPFAPIDWQFWQPGKPGGECVGATLRAGPDGSAKLSLPATPQLLGGRLGYGVFQAQSSRVGLALSATGASQANPTIIIMWGTFF